MDLGSQAPRTRARWQTGRMPAGAKNCPCWIRNVGGFFQYFDPVSPITSRLVLDFMMSPAKWSYDPDIGAVFYEGTWDDGHYDGRWGWQIQPDELHFAVTRMYITLPVGDPTTGVYIMSSLDLDVEGVFSGAFNTRCMNDVDIRKDLPWNSHGSNFMRWLTYSQIVALGENPRDTSPLTWTGEFRW